MCGRYQLQQEAERMLLDLMPAVWRYGRTPGRSRPNICPMTRPPVVRLTAGAEAPRMEEFNWGIKIPQRLLVNAKSENARIHAQNLTHRRCLVPASGYYEWFAVTPKLKVPQHIRPADGQPFCFAGIWGPWTQPGAEGEGFVIMTCAPGQGIGWVHDRMPVVVPQEAWQRWLSPDIPFQNLKELLDQVIVPYSQQIPWTVDAVSAIPSGKAAETLTTLPATLPWWTPDMGELLAAAARPSRGHGGLERDAGDPGARDRGTRHHPTRARVPAPP